MNVRLVSRSEPESPPQRPAVAAAIDKPTPPLHLVVHVSETEHSADLVREAHRLAHRLPARWTALHVEAGPVGELAQSALRLAEQLGGEAVILPGRDAATEILAYARANRTRHIMIGEAPRRGWTRWLAQPLAKRLLGAGATVSVHVVAAAAEAAGKPAPRRFALLPQLAAIGAVAVAAAVGYPLQSLVSEHDVALVLLMAVVFTALRFGLWPSVTASVLSVAVYDFFFLPPVYSFRLADPSDALTLVCFLAVALTVSSLTAQTQRQTAHLIERIRTISALYAFSRKAVGIGSLDDLLQMTVAQLAEAAGAGIVLLLPSRDGLQPRAASPAEPPLAPSEVEAAALCRGGDYPTEAGPPGYSLFLPLRTQRGAIGVVCVRAHSALSPATRRLLDALIDQAAIAIERIRLTEDVDEARLQAETERLRSALLTSVSHDLRTPLAYIIGALSSLKSSADRLDADTRQELVDTAQDEAERLDRHVGNLLDMTRLESGALQVTRVPVALDEVIGAAISRARPLLCGHRIEVRLSDEPPLVEAGFMLLEQVLFNLLDNGAKYTPAGSTITIAGTVCDAVARVTVSDDGPGIAPEALATVFDRFTRHAATGQAGAGLGLAICQGFVAAMGGTITADNRTDRPGAIFTITLEISAVPHAR
jgi:two-component system sensor histidine kinase KdpD